MINVKFPETEFVGCRFPEVTGRNGEVNLNSRSKEYIYQILPGMEHLSVGTMVVVACSNGFQVAIVTSVDKSIPADWKKEDVAYVVGTVDYNAYTELLDKQKMKAELKRELMRKKKELDEQFALELYADKSPEFKELLDQYNSLC